MIYLVNIGGK
jgi:obg-like ATPase 1